MAGKTANQLKAHIRLPDRHETSLWWIFVQKLAEIFPHQKQDHKRAQKIAFEAFLIKQVFNSFYFNIREQVVFNTVTNLVKTREKNYENVLRMIQH